MCTITEKPNRYLSDIETRVKNIEALVGGFGSLDFERLLRLIKEQPPDQGDEEDVVESSGTPPMVPSKRRRLITAGNMKSDHLRQIPAPIRPLVTFLEDSNDLSDPSDAMGSIKFGDEQNTISFGSFNPFHNP